jgi:hypothetical protein
MTTDSGNCRFCSFGSHDNKIGSVFDYLRYRTLLDPIEVSNRWYIYYSNSDSKRSFISTLTLKENPKASAIIGRWAYYERFPLLYSGFLNANASIDAESYSFGSLGWFLIIFILVVLRLCVGVLLASKNFIFQCLGLAAISHLAFLTFQAGPFAIVFAQGLLIIPLVTFFIILLKRFAKL